MQRGQESIERYNSSLYTDCHKSVGPSSGLVPAAVLEINAGSCSRQPQSAHTPQPALLLAGPPLVGQPAWRTSLHCIGRVCWSAAGNQARPAVLDRNSWQETCNLLFDPATAGTETPTAVPSPASSLPPPPSALHLLLPPSLLRRLHHHQVRWDQNTVQPGLQLTQFSAK